MHRDIEAERGQHRCPAGWRAENNAVGAKGGTGQQCCTPEVGVGRRCCTRQVGGGCNYCSCVFRTQVKMLHGFHELLDLYTSGYEVGKDVTWIS